MQENYQILNIGNSNTVNLMAFINTLENILNKQANKHFVDMQAGDVHETFADISKICNLYGFTQKTEIQFGLKRFIEWYNNYTVISKKS